jgi:hypothetical protein
MSFPLRFPREMEWFLRAGELLRAIQGDPGRVDLVLALQQLLIRRLARLQLRHGRLQRARLRLKQRLLRDRLIGEKARATKELVLKIQDRCDGLEHLRFLYRCFGDGIAALYHAPRDHRYFYFEQRTLARDRSGPALGTPLFRRQYRALRLGIGAGLPVVLAEVTNMLRQGDACVLAGDEPQSLELGSFAQPGSAGTLRRHELLRTMKLLARKGPWPVQAHPQALEHQAHLNACVQQAMAHEIAQAQAEPGLRYVVVRSDRYLRDPDCLQAFQGAKSRSTMSIQVAPEMAWVPMQPFTLSMEAGHAALFMQGAFQLFVDIDVKVLVSHFASLGVHAMALMDGVTALEIASDPDDLGHGAYRISEVIFQRIACEFISLHGFAQEMAGVLELAQTPGEHDAGDGDLLFAPPPDGDEVRNCYDDEGPRLH